MPKLRDLRQVDVDYATTGPNHTVLRQPVAKSAQALFRALEDGPAWKEWLDIDVEWTSPQPFGVGTTRTVRTKGQQIDETFLAWEEGARMTFRFERTTLPMAAFAEDYVITSKGPNACELAWHYAFEWGGPLAPVGSKVFGFVFAKQGKAALGKLAKMMAGTSRFD